MSLNHLQSPHIPHLPPPPKSVGKLSSMKPGPGVKNVLGTTDLKYTIQCLLLYLQVCVDVITVLEHFHHLKKKLASFSCHCPIPPSAPATFLKAPSSFSYLFFSCGLCQFACCWIM